MSQHWTIAGALLAFALLDAACADPEQDASSGAASGGSTSVSLHVVFLDGAYHEDGTELVWNEPRGG
ncbi:hypothetical protein WMF45_12160 [Sorangium sp. So ce448]|uniref:hypothetical protein n=1 Tax=Sorangium sp. So ce448 TaxID=3133314 RepID=UPI003F5D8E09